MVGRTCFIVLTSGDSILENRRPYSAKPCRPASYDHVVCRDPSQLSLQNIGKIGSLGQKIGALYDFGVLIIGVL